MVKIDICTDCLGVPGGVCDACRAKAINDALCKRCRRKLADTLEALSKVGERQTKMAL